MVGGARQAHRQHRGGLAFQGQVGQHATHDGLVQQAAAEGLAMRRVMQRLRQRLAQQRGAAQHAIQAGGGGHLQQHGHAPARLAQHHAPGLLELHFRAGVAAVAHLVLQAPHAHGIARPVGNPARHEKAGGSRVHPRQHEMRVGLRNGEEPFVACQQIRAAPAARPHRRRAGGHGAQVGAALLLGQAHADQCAALAGQGRVGAVEFARVQRGKPVTRIVEVARRFAHQQRHGGMGHGGGAQRAGLGLALHQIGGGTRRLRAGLAAQPGIAVQAAGDDAAHQLRPGGMELDAIHAVARVVIGMQDGTVAVGQFGRLQGLRAAQPGAVLAQFVLPGARAFAGHGLAQHRVGVVQRIVFERRHLVGHLMRAECLHAGLPGPDGVRAPASRHYASSSTRRQASAARGLSSAGAPPARALPCSPSVP
ncbi:Uncharacterised protein [Bordetella ansorpii]|uniref:Uncharacterized protein n=1 Tax=Bordetella ansorpii TaxID=288768 RepID=A0A157MZ21_9BORD|nr:Uncharacterised protein [Bordetella ansorpii]